MPKLEKEVRDWEHKFKAMDAIKDAKSKVKALKNEMAWSYVNATKTVSNKKFHGWYMLAF